MIKEPIYCGKCSADVPEDASSCPYCGAFFKSQKTLTDATEIKEALGKIKNFGTLVAPSTRVVRLTPKPGQELSRLSSKQGEFIDTPRLWDSKWPGEFKWPDTLSVKETYDGEVVAFRPGDKNKDDFIRKKLLDGYDMIDTTGGARRRGIEYRYGQLPTDVRIFEISRRDMPPTVDARVAEFVGLVHAAREKLLVSNFSDIIDMLTDAIVFSDGDPRKSKEKFLLRNRRLDDITIELKKKQKCCLVINAKPTYYDASTQTIVDKWSAYMPGNMIYQFKLDDSRL